MMRQVKTVDGNTGDVMVRDMSQDELDASSKTEHSSMEAPAGSIEQRILALEAAVAVLAGKK